MKLKIAFYWCSSCGGCEETVVDLNEAILDVVEKADILFWPVALDFKYSDVENMPDGHIDVCFLNGAIRLDEQEEIAKLLRCKSKVLIAFGACAHQGGIPGLANFHGGKACLKTAYEKVPTLDNPENTRPLTQSQFRNKSIKLPEFYQWVKTLDQVVHVDYYIPGCPPQPHNLLAAFTAIVENKLPPAGSVIGSKKALCETCPRNKTKPDKLKIEKFQRYWDVDLNTDRCFLLDGII